MLIGLVQPKADMVEACNDWYLGNHVEDTYNAPHITSARCYRAVRGFVTDAPSGYLTIYEFTGTDAEEAERLLGEYQSDPEGWAERRPNNGSLEIVSAGWYEEHLTFGI